MKIPLRSFSALRRLCFLPALLLLLPAALLSAHTAHAQIRMRGITTDLSDSADRFISLDLNGDGKSDLLYFRPGGGYALAYLSHGDGTFREVDYTRGGTPYNGFPGNLSSTQDTFVAGDFNGDGKSDFIEYRPGSGYTFLCLSLGDGSVKCESLSTPSGPAYGFNDSMTQGSERIVTLDLNGDGKSDFIVYAPGSGFAHAYLSNGDGTLTPFTVNGFFQSDFNASDAVIVPLDVNHDGRADLLISAPKSGGGVLRLYLNHVNNTFSRFDLSDGTANHDGFQDNAGAANAHLIALDLNGDGWMDFLWWQAGSSVVTGYTSRGDGTFNYIPYQTSNSPQNGFATKTSSATDTAVAVNLDPTAPTGFLWYTPGQGNVVAYHSSASGALTAQSLTSPGSESNNFQDADQSPNSMAIAANFRGPGTGGFFWYVPGKGLLQAYEGLNGPNSPLNYYSFVAYPATYLSDLNWSIGNVPLKEVVMLGTHDAAMYSLNLGTSDIAETQLGDFNYQLTYGARVFDFRSGYYFNELCGISDYEDISGNCQSLDTGDAHHSGFYMFGHSTTLTDYSPFTLLSQVEDWLTKNPNEVALIDMNNTNGNDSGGFQGSGNSNYGPQFIQMLKQTDHSNLLYTPMAACGKDTCPSNYNPQNMTINQLKALGTRLILMDVPSVISSVGWQNSLHTAGYCSGPETGTGGSGDDLSEIECINYGDTTAPGLGSVRPDYTAGDADTQFFGLKAVLTPFGDYIPPLPPVLLAEGSPGIQGFNNGTDSCALPIQLSGAYKNNLATPPQCISPSTPTGGAWSPNSLNLVYLDAITGDAVENQFIARNDQTWINTEFPNSNFPQRAGALSVGLNGDAWAAGTGHNISLFHYNPATGAWVAALEGEPNVKNLAADAKGGVWVVQNAPGETYGLLVHFNASGLQDYYGYDPASDVAVGRNGSVWMVDPFGSVEPVEPPTDGSPYIGASIPNIAAHAIAVDNRGYPWVIDTTGHIQRFNGSSWQMVGYTFADEIVASADGSIFIHEFDTFSDFNANLHGKIGRLNSLGTGFDYFHMDTDHIAVDGAGHPWAIRHATGEIYKGALDQM